MSGVGARLCPHFQQTMRSSIGDCGGAELDGVWRQGEPRFVYIRVAGVSMKSINVDTNGINHEVKAIALNDVTSAFTQTRTLPDGTKE
jgi:hypothetical protein